MLPPADWLLRRLVVLSLVLMTPGLHQASTGPPSGLRRASPGPPPGLRRAPPGCSGGCYCSESRGGGRTVRCSNLQLTRVPPDLPNDTRRAYLDYNLIGAVPADAFLGLPDLVELDLSHNRLSRLEPGAFRGLAASLRVLDLSSNRLADFRAEAFGGLRARANLSDNPWHCDCGLQTALPRVALEPASLAGLVCHTSEPEDAGVAGRALLLAPDADLCAAAKRTTDVAMLVVMLGWFAMVVSYLVYYVRANQEDARRHLEYLKSLPSLPGKSEESSTVSTVV